MLSYVKTVLSLNVELTFEERNLLAIAYKSVFSPLRDSWWVISRIEQNDVSAREARIKYYRQKIQQELEAVCRDVLEQLEHHLLPWASSPESSVFYCKMKGDYYRYLAEVAVGPERKDAAQHCLEAYRHATATSVKLPSTDPIRLGLALNLSVFYHEILGSPVHACEVAKRALTAAIDDLEEIPEQTLTDSMAVMRILKDNVHRWTDEVQRSARKPSEQTSLSAFALSGEL